MYIVYSEEHSDAVYELSGFLVSKCGIACDMDQYHTLDNIPHWGVWIQGRIETLAKHKGFVLLVCSHTMYQQLSELNVSQIKMKFGDIDSLALNNLIKGPATTHCVIPVCLEELNKKIVPISLRDRIVYHLSYSTLMQVAENNVETILDKPELESLRSLVFRLRGEKEVIKPSLGKCYHLCHYNV